MGHIGHSHLEYFADRVVNLPVQDKNDKRAQVNTLRQRLEKHIKDNPDFSLVKMLHAGSVAKGTALRTVNDFDVAVYVRKKDAPSESQLISWTADRLRDAYGDLLESDQIQPATHCVTVTFKGSGTVVDVVPVLYEGDADDRGYLVTKDTGERLLTSVRLHLDFVRTRKAANRDYAQIVRLIKWWVRERKLQDAQFRFKSFMVELVVAKLADRGASFADYPAALQTVFAELVKTELKQRISFTDYYPAKELPPAGQYPIEVVDPANSQNNAARLYTTSDRDRIVDAAEDALDAITEASFSTTKERAVERWQSVLGSRFRGDIA